MDLNRLTGEGEETPSLFELLRKYDLYPTRSLGQVFLQDEKIIQFILGILNLQEEDLVVEIGAGPGLITRELARRAGRVLALEIDRKFEPIHQELFASLSRPPQVIYEDARKADYASLLGEPQGRLLVFGNLPYYLTTDLILTSLNRFPGMFHALFMVEEEVSERLLAKPGTKKYGTLAGVTQLFGHWRNERTVSRQVFFPKPKVTSALLSLIPSEDKEKIRIASNEDFHRFMIGLMQYRRKTLNNSLKENGIPVQDPAFLEVYGVFMEKYDLPAGIRAEQLSPEQIGELFLLVSRLSE